MGNIASTTRNTFHCVERFGFIRGSSFMAHKCNHCCGELPVQNLHPRPSFWIGSPNAEYVSNRPLPYAYTSNNISLAAIERKHLPIQSYKPSPTHRTLQTSVFQTLLLREFLTTFADMKNCAAHGILLSKYVHTFTMANLPLPLRENSLQTSA